MLCAARCVQHAEVSLLMALADGGAPGSVVFRSFSIFLSIASSMSPNPRPSESYTRMRVKSDARAVARAHNLFLQLRIQPLLFFLRFGLSLLGLLALLRLSIHSIGPLLGGAGLVGADRAIIDL